MFLDRFSHRTLEDGVNFMFIFTPGGNGKKKIRKTRAHDYRIPFDSISRCEQPHHKIASLLKHRVKPLLLPQQLLLSLTKPRSPRWRYRAPTWYCRRSSASQSSYTSLSSTFSTPMTTLLHSYASASRTGTSTAPHLPLITPRS